MEPLNIKLNKLKSGLKKQEQEDKEWRNKVLKALVSVFGSDKEMDRCISNFYIRNNRIFLVPTNKTSANELVYKKHILNGILNSEIVIK